MAYGRKTGGRQAGTRNKVTTAARGMAQATGILPLEYMLQVMRDTEADKRRRDSMAMAAAPYLHPRVASNSIDSIAIAAQSGAENVGIRVTFVKPPRVDDD